MEPRKASRVTSWSLLGALVLIEAVLFYFWSSSSADGDMLFLLSIVVWAVGIVAMILFLTLLEGGREPRRKA